jgi:hypothetical protein
MDLEPWERVVDIGAIRNGTSSHERYSSSHSKTLRAAMGCSVRFAGNSSRANESRIEGSPVNMRCARQTPKKNLPGWV